MANEQELVVTIKVGNHSWKPPRGMDKVFHKLLYACGVRGSREVLMGDIIRGANGARKVEVANFDPDTNCIFFYSQPAGKGRRHQCSIIIPKEFRNNPSEFINKLYKETGDKRYVAPVPVQQPKKPTYNFSKKGNEMQTDRIIRKRASEVLSEEDTLFSILDSIDKLLDGEGCTTNGKILAEIRRLGLDCWERGVYKLLLSKRYISESDRTTKTARVALTDKSRELLAKHAPAPKEKIGIDIEAESKRLREAFSEYQKAMADLLENRSEQSRLRGRLAELERLDDELISLINRLDDDAKLFQRLQALYNPAF